MPIKIKSVEKLYILKFFYICINMLNLSAKCFMTINRPVQDEVGRLCG
ncbi:hypothetical protein ABIB60_003395 [Hymenobacter sp. UYP22]